MTATLTEANEEQADTVDALDVRLKAITHATGSKIGSSRSRWNRGTEYYPVAMKTHIEYPNIFF